MLRRQEEAASLLTETNEAGESLTHCKWSGRSAGRQHQNEPGEGEETFSPRHNLHLNQDGFRRHKKRASISFYPGRI